MFIWIVLYTQKIELQLSERDLTTKAENNRSAHQQNIKTISTAHINGN